MYRFFQKSSYSSHTFEKWRKTKILGENFVHPLHRIQDARNKYVSKALCFFFYFSVVLLLNVRIESFNYYIIPFLQYKTHSRISNAPSRGGHFNLDLHVPFFGCPPSSQHVSFSETPSQRSDPLIINKSSLSYLQQLISFYCQKMQWLRFL